MKLLIVGNASVQGPLIEGLMASPLWEVRCCADVAEAEAAAEREAFDYILVEPAHQARLEAAAAEGRRDAGARVIHLNEATGAELKSAEGDAVYGCYAVSPHRAETGPGSWIFEYHAPCRTARRA